MTQSSPLLASYPPLALELDHAAGCELIARDGTRYLDLYGGHCVCILGHNPPALRDALMQQMERITFYSVALHLPERDEAARALIELAPAGFGKVFFVNSGAEANENAVKFACAHTKRSVIVAIEGAFHGRTAAADVLCGGAARTPHYPHAPVDVRWVNFGDAQGMRDALAPGDVAAVILEPVQSMGGCRVHPADVVDAINEGAAQHNTLVIADEVQGGFWRCGAAFSHEAIGLRADLITCAKGLAAGVPAGAVIVRESLGEPSGGYFGSTFGGGPLASAAIRVVCAAVGDAGFQQHVAQVSEVFDRIAKLEGVDELLGLGCLRGIRISGGRAKAVKAKLFERAMIVGGSSDADVLRLMPPLTLSVEQAERFVAVLQEVLAETA